MAWNAIRKKHRAWRTYGEGHKAEAVQTLLDGHVAASVAKILGLRPILLYR
jgi:hypothetical protein